MAYVRFCQPDNDFYDTPAAQRENDFPLVAELLPDGWLRQFASPWVAVHPAAVLVEQGWKIHVTAHAGNATDVLDTVWRHCRERRVHFKFLRSAERLREANSKYADRGSSGKFITIYPADVEQFREVLTELGDLLAGQRGPHVLSDLRWREGPLSVRYGGFIPMHCTDERGDRVPALRDSSGKLVPDQRRPGFHVPEWVEVPEILRDQIERNREKSVDFDYRPKHALHFSNGGGVYVADDRRTGREVVLKEARPYAGLDGGGTDAVARLEHEAEVLSRLAGLPGVPASYGCVNAWEHRFLVLEKIDGLDLKRASMQRTPVLRPDATDEDTAAYTAWAVAMSRRLDATLRAIHERGVVVGDVHPKNIIVRGDEPVFLDFEFSGIDVDDWVAPQGAPGYRAPAGITGRAADRWALAAVKLDLFLPQTMLIEYERGKASQLVELAARRFGFDAEFAGEILAGLGVDPAERRIELMRPATPVTAAFLGVDEPPGWDEVVGSLADAVTASADPAREDRLFPGDIQQFLSCDGIGFGYGAAGVLHALHSARQDIDPRHIDWLARKAETATRAGFYTGLHGIAYALDELGRTEGAHSALDAARALDTSELGIDLFGGLAGIGLNLLHFALRPGGSSLWSDIDAVDSALRSRLTESTSDKVRPGLMLGWSAAALFWIRLHEATGRPESLDLAAAALRRDLAECTVTKNGTLEADEGWRTLPYLHTGSVGVGIVLTEYLKHARPDDFVEADRAILRAATYEHYGMPIVSHGSAGILLYLCNRPDRPQRPIDQALSTLRYHALPYRGHIAFRGNQSLRLSMDLLTGTAGVLLAVDTATADGRGLPFLPPQH